MKDLVSIHALIRRKNAVDTSLILKFKHREVQLKKLLKKPRQNIEKKYRKEIKKALEDKLKVVRAF